MEQCMYLDFPESSDRYRLELRQELHDRLPDGWEGIFADEDSWRWSRDFCEALGSRGWLTRSWPSQYGGLDGSAWDHAVTQEEMWAHHEPR
jgi:alkylation response protein AidB-like acyl-CoA dehydrogenase